MRESMMETREIIVFLTFLFEEFLEDRMVM